MYRLLYVILPPSQNNSSLRAYNFRIKKKNEVLPFIIFRFFLHQIKELIEIEGTRKIIYGSTLFFNPKIACLFVYDQQYGTEEVFNSRCSVHNYLPIALLLPRLPIQYYDVLVFWKKKKGKKERKRKKRNKLCSVPKQELVECICFI